MVNQEVFLPFFHGKIVHPGGEAQQDENIALPFRLKTGNCNILNRKNRTEERKQ